MEIKGGALIISRGNFEIAHQKEIDEYYSVLMPLYKKYGYRPVLKGMKSADVHGFTIQMNVGLGFFPSVEKALECHEDSGYKDVLALRGKFMWDYQLSLYGDLDTDLGIKTENGWTEKETEYAEDKTFIIYKNSIDRTRLERIKPFIQQMHSVMSKYGYTAFYSGKKVKDLEGKPTLQEYLGIGYYPDTHKAKECFLDNGYLDLSDERETFTKNFETTIYGPLK